MPAIAFETLGLSKSFAKKRALDGLYMSFEAGLLHGLVGPSGAGKTTLMRLITGLLRPDEGRVLFRQGSTELPLAEARPFMAYQPQRAHLYADLSIGEHLAFFRDLYRLPRDQYKERRQQLLSVTRLEPFVDRLAGELSGGMYKKLGLMCALLQSPSLLLLDEPTTGVDPISRREFWDLLYNLTESGEVTIVMSTSYMDEAERCPRIHLIDAGQMLLEGEPHEVLRDQKAMALDDLFLRHEEKKPA